MLWILFISLLAFFYEAIHSATVCVRVRNIPVRGEICMEINLSEL